MLESRFGIERFENMLKDAEKMREKYDRVEIGITAEDESVHLYIDNHGYLWGFTFDNGLNQETALIAELKEVNIFGRKCRVTNCEEGGVMFSEVGR